MDENATGSKAVSINVFDTIVKKSKRIITEPFVCEFDPNEKSTSKQKLQCTIKRVLVGSFMIVLIVLLLLFISLAILWKIPSVDYKITGTILSIVIFILIILPSLFIGFLIVRKNQKNAMLGVVLTTILVIVSILSVFVTFQL